MTTSNTEHIDNHASAASGAKGPRDLFWWISAGTGMVSGLLVVYFVSQVVHQTFGELIFWEHVALAVVFSFLAILSWIFGTAHSGAAAGRSLNLAIAVQFSMVVLALLVANAGIPAALIGLVYTLMIGFLAQSLGRSDSIVMFGILSAIAAYFLTTFSPLPQISFPMMVINLIALLGLLVMVYMAMLAMGFVVATLSVKLISASLAISLIPLLIFSSAQASFTRNALLNESTGSLRLAANQTASKVDTFLYQNIQGISLNSIYPSYAAFLKSDPEAQADGPQRNAVLASISSLQASSTSSYLDSIAILDKDGIDVYDTRPEATGHSEKNQEYFSVPMGTPYNLQKSYVSAVIFSESGVPYIVFSDAIRDEYQKPIGVLRIRYNGAVLQSLIQTSGKLLGSASYPLLTDEYGIRLGDGSGNNLTFQPISPLTNLQRNDLFVSNRLPANYQEMAGATNIEMQQAINGDEEEPFFTFFPNGDTTGVENAGIGVRLQNAPWNVVYVQPMTSFRNMIDQQSRTTTLLVTLLALIVSVAAAFLSRLFSGRILKLAQTAEQITAGNLNVSAEVEEGDEIGMLGRAFNVMIRQLHGLIDELEARVASRTAELSRQNETLQVRSQQMKTVSDVARSIASTNDLETLLNQVAVLVSHRFGFYHVGIFLVDEQKEYAYLRASNSEGGRKMLERKHMLKIGEVGIVGYACSLGEARIATDVGQDATFFNNPDLPYTRSEMALPLRANDQIIGALDVQSVESNAFSEDDIELFSILADQVAIAIVNNRLYAETNETLAEIKGLHSWYLRNEWTREVENRRHLRYRYTPQGVVPLDEQIEPEVAQVQDSGQMIAQSVLAGEAESQSLAVPITLRGETIGAIQLQDQGGQQREWSQAEISSVKAVAEQIALALENARLFEQTSRRANRERKVLEITSKIRSTNDFQTMLRVAVEELQQALNASRAQVILQGVEQNAPAEPYNGNGHK